MQSMNKAFGTCMPFNILITGEALGEIRSGRINVEFPEERFRGYQLQISSRHRAHIIRSVRP